MAKVFEKQAPQTKVIKALEISPSTWHKSKAEPSEDKRKQNKGRPLSQISKTTCGQEVSNEKVIQALKDLRGQEFFKNGGGYKKLTQYLKRDHNYVVNKKKVYRLCKEHDLLLPQKVKRKKQVAPISINRRVSCPFQLWELDIKYGYLSQEKRFFFVMVIIDVYLRYVLSYHIGRRCLGLDIKRTKVPLVVRMDNGPQMTSKVLSEFIRSKEGLSQELIPLQTPNKNAHIESFYSILERECFQAYQFKTFDDAYETVGRFMQFYQERKIHSSLGYRTPKECYELYNKGRLKGIKEVCL